MTDFMFYIDFLQQYYRVLREHSPKYRGNTPCTSSYSVLTSDVVSQNPASLDHQSCQWRRKRSFSWRDVNEKNSTLIHRVGILWFTGTFYYRVQKGLTKILSDKYPSYALGTTPCMSYPEWNELHKQSREFNSKSHRCSVMLISRRAKSKVPISLPPYISEFKLSWTTQRNIKYIKIMYRYNEKIIPHWL